MTRDRGQVIQKDDLLQERSGMEEISIVDNQFCLVTYLESCIFG